MSKARKKLESQVASESHDLCSPKFPPADPSTIPFEEWCDSDINIEKWEISKDSNENLFRDPQETHLPPSLLGLQWKRPCEVFPDANFTIFTENPAYPDLIAGSKHILHSEFVLSFIHTIQTLCYLGNTGQFPVEYTSLQFFPTTTNQPWKPWHHVYSKCHAGKGQHHNPTVNKFGKYIVRLFWLGSWKKIYVDDLLPLNAEEEILLPSLPIPKDPLEPFQIKKAPSEKQSKHTKLKISAEVSKSRSTIGNKKVIELWPFLLAKALMKLANLTWCEGEDLVDFDMIQCFSGWIPYKISTRGMTTDEIWDECMKYTSHYKWQEHQDRSTSKMKIKSKSKVSVRDNLGKTKSGDLGNRDDHEKYSLALCFRHSNCSMVGGNTHHLLIEQTRNVSLVKPSKEEDFPLWKRYRWLDWAIENNILPPKESATPIKFLKSVDPFKEICNSIYGDDKTEDETPRKLIGPESNKDLSKKGDGSRRRLEFTSYPSLTKWLDFERVSGNILHLIVYFKPSKYPVKVRISDLCSKNITKELKYPVLKALEDSMVLEWKEIIRTQSSLFHRNEPVYILSDSLSSRRVIINIAQVGSQQVLQSDSEGYTEENNLEPSDSECGICLSTILERLKKKNAQTSDEDEVNKIPVIPNEYNYYRLVGHLVLCKFKWNSDHTDDVVQSIRTYGTSTISLNLEPGRHLFRLLIKTGTPYVIQILSDAPLAVGYLEEIYPLMTEETCLINEMSKAIAKSFQELVKSFGKGDYLDKFRNFHDSYKPPCELDKEELTTIHEVFSIELLRLVSYDMGEAELRALKVLLKQWQFPHRENNSGDTSGFCYQPDAEEMEYVKIIQKATVMIQAFFRGVYERQMMKRHSSSDKHYKATVECLQRIHSLFSSKGVTLLRNYFFTPDVLNIAEKRGCCEDIQSAITLYQFSNSTRVSDQGWNFICRQTFYVSSMQPIVLRINMFCDLTRYSVRAFDNDDGKEMKIHTNNVASDEYHSNANGYTVLCYGMSSTAKQLYYKLCYAVQKETTEKMLHFPHNQTKNEVLTGNYIPSKRNRICRYMILVNSEHALATLQLSTNHPDVKINMKLFKDDELLNDVTGIGSVLLPVLMLGNKTSDTCRKIYKEESLKSVDKKSNTKGLHKSRTRSHSNGMEDREKMYDVSEVYFLEANVMENSWPLNAAEWKVVERLKADKLLGDPNGSIKKGSATKKHSISEIQSPFWTLQVITGSTDLVRLSTDEKRDMELRQNKIRWYSNDPMRNKKSEELRNTFIDENKITNGKICLDGEIRTSNPEIFEEEVLPDYDTYCDMYRKIPLGDATGERVLKDGLIIEEEIENEFRAIVRFREFNENIAEEIAEMEKTQIDNYNLMKDWYNGCRLESEKMIEDAHKVKQKYIEIFSESTAIVKEKDKKEKKATKKSKNK
ncbi:unnamed protein product [Phaedon cochleariae]|uniref:Androglobin n=1 Tax=Phaedon cochleariae TaxID=80249 RepID=A0A9P0DIE8_PHACE|nr:unnamed protein product [Phaedon cochleariae]